MEGLDLVDRLLELGVMDGRESELRLWLTHNDKAAIFDAVEQHGRLALESVTKGGITLYSRELRQAVGHDAEFLEHLFLAADPASRAMGMKYTGPSKILLAWADHKFPDSPFPAIDSYSPFEERAKYLSAGQSESAGSVIYGSQFVATMQMRTPLRVLEQHGRIERCDSAKLPKLIREPWQGIWSVKTRSLREIGIDLNDFPEGQMASEIGPIDADGGDLLRFMILVKRIARSDTNMRDKELLMESCTGLIGAGGHDFKSFIKHWGGPSVVLARNL